MLQQLVETVKNPAASVGSITSPSIGKDDKNRQTRDQKVYAEFVCACSLEDKI